MKREIKNSACCIIFVLCSCLMSPVGLFSWCCSSLSFIQHTNILTFTLLYVKNKWNVFFQNVRDAYQSAHQQKRQKLPHWYQSPRWAHLPRSWLTPLKWKSSSMSHSSLSPSLSSSSLISPARLSWWLLYTSAFQSIHWALCFSYLLLPNSCMQTQAGINSYNMLHSHTREHWLPARPGWTYRQIVDCCMRHQCCTEHHMVRHTQRVVDLQGATPLCRTVLL